MRYIFKKWISFANILFNHIKNDYNIYFLWIYIDILSFLLIMLFYKISFKASNLHKILCRIEEESLILYRYSYHIIGRFHTMMD